MSPVLGLLPLIALLGAAPEGAPAYEIDAADVSTAADACPTQDQIADALGAHMPGVVARPGREPAATALHLAITLTPEGVARVTMTDATGGLRLERDLDLPKSEAAPGEAARPAHERGAACATLAETIALIVERYMRHIGYHEPPPPELVAAPAPAAPVVERPVGPSGPGGRLGVGAGARPPWGMPWRLEPGVTGGLRIGHLDLSASVAFTIPISETVPMSTGRGTLTLWALPVRLAIGWALPLRPRLSLAPTVAAGADLTLARTRGIGLTRQSADAEPVVEGGLRATLALTQRVWIDLQAFQGIDLRPEVFYVSTAPPGTETLLMTPRTYTRVGIDFGVFLGKNRPLP
jgi:hypothetical protein